MQIAPPPLTHQVKCDDTRLRRPEDLPRHPRGHWNASFRLVRGCPQKFPDLVPDEGAFTRTR